MKKILATLCALIVHISIVLAQGVEFEKGTLEEAVAKAIKTKKILYVDVYAVWCSPCKQMDKNVFPKKEVGDYFNANFINYKIDGESEAGEVIVNKYKIKGYPASLFLNPKDMSVISLDLGGVDVNGFLKLGKTALEEYKDSKSWKDYQKEFAKGKYDKAFLERYIVKGNKIGENTDAAIDAYVDKYKPEVPQEDFITFLSYNIKSLNNKGVDYIVNLYKDLPDGINALEAWLPDMYDNTLDRAVEAKNIKVLDKILWAAEITQNKQAAHLYNRYQSMYYEKMKDWDNFFVALDKEMSNYQNKTIEEYRKEDSLAYEDMVTMYKAQLKEYGVPEAEYMDYINEQTKDKIEAKYQVSYMAAASINDGLDKVLEFAKDNKDILTKSLSWAEFMLQIVEPMEVQWAYFGMTAAEIYAKNNMKEKSKALLEKALLKANNNSGVRTLILEEMKKY